VSAKATTAALVSDLLWREPELIDFAVAVQFGSIVQVHQPSGEFLYQHAIHRLAKDPGTTLLWQAA
jgi:hypothetical protein